MNTKSLLFLLSLTLIVSSLVAQPRKLGKADFKSAMLDQWWSSENKDVKKECDMRILVVKSNGFELNCVNWTAGFLGNKCAYDLTITDNFFELKAKNCENNVSPGFLYGYLSESDNLFLLVRTKSTAISSALLSEKDWIKFEKIKR